MFNIDGAITIQRSTLVTFKTWDVRKPTRTDDTLIDGGSGNIAENTPSLFFSITPSFHKGGFSTGLTIKYMGDRQANNFNVFVLPAFATFDLRLSYEFNKHFNISYNCNNLFQSQGVMSWSAPSAGGQALDRAGFTKAKYDAAKAAGLPLSVIITQPRSHFVTLVYNF